MACKTQSPVNSPPGETKAVAITEAEVNAAQQAWCDGLVNIGKVYQEHGDYQAAASQFIDELYDFKEGKVFFRPTLAKPPHEFRTTKAGTLSYFVGGNPDYPEDKGFALKPWIKVRYDNNIDGKTGIQIHGDIALVMGKTYFTPADGSEVVVDKVFAFRKGADGKLRMAVHSSALANSPAE
jgi:hypothetical protein